MGNILVWFTDPALFVISMLVIGAMVGSFSNVVIYRLPVMLWRRHEIKETPFNLSVPRSRCPICGNNLRFYHNIPIFSWVFLLGKCGFCSTPIPARYILVELSFAFVSAFSAYFIGGFESFLASITSWLLMILLLIFIDNNKIEKYTLSLFLISSIFYLAVSLGYLTISF